MERWSQLHAFVESARAGSFSAAARAAGTTPSAFSKMVGKLEASLGVRLLTRGARGLALTAEGEALHAEAQRAMDDLEEALVRVTPSTAPQGLVRVSGPLDVGRAWLLPRVADFCRAHPRVELEVDLTDRYVDLVAERFDVALRVGHVDDGRLLLRRVGRLRRGYCAAPSYLRAHGVPPTPEALADHAGLAYMRNGARVPWELPSGGRMLPRGSFAASSNESLRVAALDGLGVAWLPEIVMADDVRSGRLRVLFEDQREEGLPIHLVFPEGRLLAPRVRAFIDFFAQAARSSLPA